MLRGIRKASANWLGRAVMGGVMGLLALSFAIWGINDIFRGFGRSTLAKIGGTEIPIETFRQTYNERLQQMSRKYGRPIPREQASAMGLDRQVLSEMIAEAGLDQRARQMRLGISDAEVVRRITTDPVFHNASGKFDPARFQDILRNNGFSEQRFIAEQRRLMLRRQIAGSVSGDFPVPKAWIEAINQYENQERSIDYVALGPAQAGEIPQPTEDELSKYFEARKAMFQAPEYRKIVVVDGTPSELGRWIEISEDDVKRFFDEHRSRYVKPEQRHVQQIVFPTMEEAQAADTRLKEGLSFAALAAERGLTEKDFDLGLATKADILDPAVGDAAFALKEGEVSAPVKGRFGAAIVTVTKIEPAEDKSVADVAAQVRKDIAAERAKAEVRSIHDKIEDERAGGSTLEEAAEKLKLPSVTYEVDFSGREQTGKPLANLGRLGPVVKAAFNSDVNVDNEPVEADGGYIWYSVAGITPSHDRKLEEVKSEVETRWREDEIATRLKAKAADLLDKLKSGNDLEGVAKANDLTVEKADKIRRGKPSGNISASMANSIFHTAKDAYGSSEGDKPSAWIVFRVTDVTTPKLEANSTYEKSISDVVRSRTADDVFGEYLAWLEDELGTSVNRAALAQALGGSSAPDTN
jgi:peptidyl-prolyl cis-trans isomerase D